MTESASEQECVLVLAPKAGDGEMAVAVLKEARLATKLCATLRELCDAFHAGAGALLIAQEALTIEETPLLIGVLNHQPQWSDIPTILLTGSRSGNAPEAETLDLFGPNGGNITLLERPFSTLTLVRALRAALRSRRRQYEVRDLIRQREEVLLSIRDAFTTVDRKWRYTYVNDKAAEMAGVPKETMLGRRIWELQKVSAEGSATAQRAMDEGVQVQFESHDTDANRWFENRIYPTEEGLSIFTTDITERKRVENQIREQAELLDLTYDAVIVRKTDGEIIYWNRGAEDLYGWAREEVIGRRSHELLQSAPPPLEIHTLLEQHGEWAGELRHVARDGRELFIDSRQLLVGAGDEGAEVVVLETNHDITDHKTSQRELERAKHEAERANAAKDDFLAALSHELRTPLTPVLMTVSAMRQAADLPPSVLEDVEMIKRNVELEARLIDDLLDLTRVTRGKLELDLQTVDLHVLLGHTVEICCEKRAGLQPSCVGLHLEAKEHHVRGDPARLQQVFWNLINNAIKFTPAGKAIDLFTSNPEPGKVAIRVRDEGAGIEAETLPRLFNAFEQGGRTITRRYGGLGLGLAISKSLVEQHGGEISAASEGSGRGATMSVVLSSAPAAESRAQAPDSPAEDTERPLRILVVEDHENTLVTLTRLLTRAGHSVECARNVAAAIETAGSDEFDLIISDLGLPDGSGIELIRKLRETISTPAIALSGYGMEEDLQASREAGFNEHLTKPVDWKRLRAAIGHVSSLETQAA
ncbi:MAG: ATP-binding protein [Verrucomicrobiota bacterium]|nr:ATP-binding protein [Verrucomicrobiota bacterium]